MSSRQEILNAIRRRRIPPVEQTPPDGPWTEYDDPHKQFAEVLEAIGGKCVVVSSEADVATMLSDNTEFNSARRVYAAIDGIENSNVDLSAIDDPHELENLDYAVLRGEFCVAENGSVWVTDEGLRHRVIYFLVQHLALVVPAENIVSNMHQAYQTLRFTEPSFGTFISGPSKTADIEQSLVIGAHGPRSLTVFLVSSSPSKQSPPISAGVSESEHPKG